MTCEELRHNLEFCLMQGISPTPGIESKFKLQYVGKIYGNYFVYLLLRKMQREGTATSDIVFLHRILKSTLQQGRSYLIGRCTLWLNCWITLQKNNSNWVYNFQLMKWKCSSKRNINTRGKSSTRQKVMVSKPMICGNKDTHTKFTR